MNALVKFHGSSSVVFAHKEDSLDQAYTLMKSIRSRHLPIVDHEGSIIGMLSDRDFRSAMDMNAGHSFANQDFPVRFKDGARVKDYMSFPVVTIDENSPVSTAARLMLEQKISALVVTRTGQGGVGVITTDDLLRVLIHEDEGAYSKLKDNLVSVFANSPLKTIVDGLANVGI